MSMTNQNIYRPQGSSSQQMYTEADMHQAIAQEREKMQAQAKEQEYRYRDEIQMLRNQVTEHKRALLQFTRLIGTLCDPGDEGGLL